MQRRSLIRNPKSEIRNSQRSLGQSLTEMALLAPVFVLVTFGMIEASRLMYAWVTVQNAARMGVRVAVTGEGEQNGNRLGLIKQAARDAAAGLPGGQVTVYVRSWKGSHAHGNGREDDPGEPCDLVEVEVRYIHRAVIPLIAPLLGNQLTLRGRERKVNEPWAVCAD